MESFLIGKSQYDALTDEIKHLKDILFVIGETAVVDWDDTIVGIVDRVLDGYRMEEEEYLLLKAELLK